MPTTDGIWRTRIGRDFARRWPVVPVLVASVLLFLALALCLELRRFSGALVEPLSLAPLLATAVITLVWAWSIRWLWATLPADRPLFAKAERLLFVWTPLVAMALVAVACSYPGRRWIDWAIWLPALAAAWYGPRMRTGSNAVAIDSTTVETQPPATGTQQMLQQLTRFRMADGREAVHGMLVAEFAPSERIATLHVAFCPPFERLPQVEAEAVEGPDASIKIVQVLHNGVRLDAQLSQVAANRESVTIELLAAESEEAPAPRSTS